MTPARYGVMMLARQREREHRARATQVIGFEGPWTRVGNLIGRGIIGLPRRISEELGLRGTQLERIGPRNGLVVVEIVVNRDVAEAPSVQQSAETVPRKWLNVK